MGLFKKCLGAFTVVAGFATWQNWDQVKDFVTESPSVGIDWDSFTTPEPQYPTAETSRLKRQEWGYGSVVKDITGFAPQQFETTSVIYESRVPVHMDDPAYDAVGQLLMLDETEQWITGSCTFSYSEIENYDPKYNRDMIIGAGHCLFDESNQPIPIERLRFKTDYIDINGQLQKFESRLSEAYGQYDSRVDLAVAILETDMPKGLHPAKAKVDYNHEYNQTVSAPAFSGDKQGAYTDPACKVKRQSDAWVKSTCDGTFGASGSALVIEKQELYVEYAAVRSSSLHAGSYLTWHSLITSSFLDQVPFLERMNATSPTVTASQGYSCLLITVEALNIRSGPGTEFNVVDQADGGAIAFETGRVGNWSTVQMETGSDAYIHSGYTKRISCP